MSNIKLRRWHLGSQNDGLFIIDQAPRPSNNDHPVHEYREGISPDLVLSLGEWVDRDRASLIVEAHNAAIAPALDLVGRIARLEVGAGGIGPVGLEHLVKMAREIVGDPYA